MTRKAKQPESKPISDQPDKVILAGEQAELEAAVRKLEAAKSLPEGLRDRVGRLLARPRDKAELIKSLGLEAQYGKRIETLGRFGFLAEAGKAREGDTPVPSLENALATFTPEMLESADRFQEPTLLLVPETSFAVKVSALDAHKAMEDQMGAYVDKIYTKSDSGAERVAGWRAVIVEGAKEMEVREGDDVELEFAERVKNRKAARKPGEKGMDRHAYALLMMEALGRGEPIDRETFTLLDDDSALSASGVPYAYWGDVCRWVGFRWHSPDVVNDGARFRSSVEGDVLI